MSNVEARIGLVNPKYPRNLGGIVRIASCYGVRDVRWSGERMSAKIESMSRIPREERMRGYADVNWSEDQRFIDSARREGMTPICVEYRPNQSESLIDFDHPAAALYVFGPEDGSVPRGYSTACHRFVHIPTRHCLNLATAVATIMYDRQAKLTAVKETQ